MVDISPIETLSIDRIEAVPLGEEVLNRIGIGPVCFRHRPVRASKLGWPRPMCSLTAVLDLWTASSFHFHRSMPVRQPVKQPCPPHRRQVAGIKAEEKHTRLTVVGYVGSDIQFGKLRDPWQRRDSR